LARPPPATRASGSVVVLVLDDVVVDPGGTLVEVVDVLVDVVVVLCTDVLVVELDMAVLDVVEVRLVLEVDTVVELELAVVDVVLVLIEVLVVVLDVVDVALVLVEVLVIVLEVDTVVELELDVELDEVVDVVVVLLVVLDVDTVVELELDVDVVDVALVLVELVVDVLVVVPGVTWMAPPVGGSTARFCPRLLPISSDPGSKSIELHPSAAPTCTVKHTCTSSPSPMIGIGIWDGGVTITCTLPVPFSCTTDTTPWPPVSALPGTTSPLPPGRRKACGS